MSTMPMMSPKPRAWASPGDVLRAMLLASLSTPIHKYNHVCGEGFLAQTRRERRAYPSGVCKEINLKTGVQTAHDTKSTRGKSVEWTIVLSVGESLLIPIQSGFAWFAYFAVPSVFPG